MTVQQQPDHGSARDLLKVENVTLQYKTPQHLVTATYRIDFTVQESERYVILGPSGCGKSIQEGVTISLSGVEPRRRKVRTIGRIGIDLRLQA